MAYSIPRTFTCDLCGGSFPSRAPHALYCPDCRPSWTLRQKRKTSKLRCLATAKERRQFAREAKRARTHAHPDSVLATITSNDGADDYEPPHAAEPTDAPPGSPAKVEVLARRVLEGRELWSDEDWTAAD